MTRGDEIPYAKPSRESLREVKREARRRKRQRALAPVPGEAYAPRSRGRVRRALSLVVVLGILGAAGWGWTRLPRREAGARSQAPVVVESFTPSPSPDAPRDPFTGSRVESWPVGMAGVRAPKAVATGTFTATEVAAAYTATRRFLRAAMLDERVLYGDQRTPVFAAMQQSSVRSRRGQDFAYLGTRFHSSVEKASDVVKVNGRIKPARIVQGVLRIDFSFSAVYALREKGGGETQRVVIRRYGTVQFDHGDTLPWLYQSSYLSSHSYCDLEWPHRGYVTTWMEAPATGGGPQPTATANLLDPDDLPPGDCFTDVGKL